MQHAPRSGVGTFVRQNMAPLPLLQARNIFTHCSTKPFANTIHGCGTTLQKNGGFITANNSISYGGRNIRPFASTVWGRPVQSSTKGRGPANLPAGTGHFPKQPDGSQKEGISHHSAFEQLASYIPETPKMSDLRSYVPIETQEERVTRIFQESMKMLLSFDRWTYGAYLAYQQRFFELIGGHDLKTKVLRQNDPNIAHVEKETRVLKAMTSAELRSNHHSVFTRETKLLIAEKADVTLHFVDQVIMMHDALRADRRWYQIRQQFNRRLPVDFLDRQQMAEEDRTSSELEKKEMKRQQEVQYWYFTKVQRKKLPRITSQYIRHPSVGGNRWSTQPPRWYPRWPKRDVPSHMRHHG